jgi:cytochrome c peroxidase
MIRSKGSVYFSLYFSVYALGIGIALACFARAALAQKALPTKAPAPADNPTTKAKVELGKQLYFDPRLSSTGTVSCNSCHNVMAGGVDNTKTGIGVKAQEGGRNSPTVWNAAFLSVQFWDGRAKSLEEQAKGPLTNPIEMGMKDHDAVMARVKEIPGYVAQFEKVFGGKDAVTIDNLAKAIAAFERTLITPGSAFDRFAKGDKNALSKQAQSGLKTAQEVGCMTCHTGPNFAGPTLPEGVGFYQKFPTFENNDYVSKYDLKDDKGRYDVTKNEADKHMWRVPTWRNVALTAPYMHNGKVATLDEAVRVMAKTQLNRDLTPEQVADIVAFLNSLTGPFPKIEAPRLPDLANRSFF